MCASWMRAVDFEGMQIVRSPTPFSLPPSPPVKPITSRPSFFADSTAASTFLELPEVEIAIATSPGLAWASS